LVFVHTALSLLVLTAAAGIYFQFIDWGWKEARKQVDVRIASEYDKRLAAYNQVALAANLAKSNLPPAQAALAAAQKSFADNHLFYVSELQRLRSEPGDKIAVK